MSTAHISATAAMSGSSHDSKMILLPAGMSVVTVLVVVLVVFIGCAVIIKIKKQKGKTE